MMTEIVQSVSKSSSPTLQSFEINPFRILRLSVDATTNDASMQSERILTLARAEISPDEPDPLPWLSPTGIYEIQPATQKIEEPLVRLTEQLLWFDAVHDKSATSIESVLANPRGEFLQKYIAEKHTLPDLSAENTEEPDVGAVANAINQANLRLLLASAILNEVLIYNPSGSDELKKINKTDWKTISGFKAIAEAHTIVMEAADKNSTAITVGHHWKEALKRWNRILNHPWFSLYVGYCIENLEDDFVSTEDTETIEKSIRTRLANLAVAETRFLLLEGRYALATEIISALSQSGFDKRLLAPSLRPIYFLFQAEIAELESLLENTVQGDFNHIASYLKRLEVIKNRWSAIDASRIIGLSQLLDEAIEQAYLQLRTKAEASPQLESLLEKTVNLASAKSLKERINSFRNELEEAKKRLCHFCNETPDYDKSVVIEGRVVTGVDHNFSETVTHYMIRYEIILRCARCARFHDFVRRAGTLVFVAILPLILTVFGSFIFGFIGCLIPIIFIGGGFVLTFIGNCFRWFINAIRRTVAWFITPPECRCYGDYKNTEAYNSMTYENYSDIKTDWRSNAVSYIKSRNI